MRHVAILALALVSLSLAACGTNESASSGGLDPAAIGAACDVDADCGTGFICRTDVPGGACTLACNGSDACPGETLCRTYGDDAWCVPRCDDDTDCRNGWFCEQVPGSDGDTYGVCEVLGGGGSTTDVGVGDDTGSGSLDVGGTDAGGEDAEPSPGSSYGAPCDVTGECEALEGLAARCLTEAQGFEDGYCSANCTPGVDECGGGAGCFNTIQGGLCMAPCDGGADCRSGYECCAQGRSGGLCLPEGLDPTCEAIGGGGGGGGGGGNDGTTPPEPGEVGAGCDGGEECEEGDDPYCFDQVPGGYCSSDCETRENCGEGNWCLQGGFGQNLCVRGCETDEACNGGQVCCDLGDAAVCLPDFLCR